MREATREETEERESPDPRIGALLQERYRIVRKIGEGGMGAVYEAQHELIGRRFAVKCLLPEMAGRTSVVERFQREARAATAIGHPNIIECTDMGRFLDGTLFMVLEYLDGRDFADELERHGPPSLGRAAHILCQICDALQAAHGKGIVHRDLKPENVFLIERGEDPDFVKVLDFGISKFLDAEVAGADPQARSLTRTGTAIGTVHYMAPEQAEGRKDVDHRADIYALGVMLYEMLTGDVPFEDESYVGLLYKICTERAPSVREVRAFGSRLGSLRMPLISVVALRWK